MNAESIKAKLKNQACIAGRTMQDMLMSYGLERTIYRISVSPYAEKFTLKGGVFLYALFDGTFARTTTDIDLLADSVHNNVENIKELFAEIFSVDIQDALYYDLSTLDVRTITEFKEYHGVKVSVMSYLERTRIPISIDIGFGDIVYPERVLMDFPVLLERMERPRIYAYSIASVIAEKFEAIVSLGYVNSRYKDFYDIYMLISKYDFNGNEVKQAIKETFLHRKTDFTDIVALEDGFINSVRKTQWNAFMKKKKTMIFVDAEMVINLIKEFMVPLIQAICNGKEYDMMWKATEQSWKR